MRILFTGSTGIIASGLLGYLVSKGHTLCCNEMQINNEDFQLSWKDNRANDFIESSPLDALFHEGIYLPLFKKKDYLKEIQIFEKSILIVRSLCEYLCSLTQKPKLFILVSDTGYYADRQNRLIEDSSFVGEGPYAELCRQFEIATQPARRAGIRVVLLRTGLILNPEGNSLLESFLPKNSLISGIWGNGKQYLSWISTRDAMEAIEYILQKDDIRGPVNLTSPTPISNRELTSSLSSSSGRSTPTFLVRHLFSEISGSRLLSSCRAYPRKLLQAGFSFNHATIEEYLLETKNSNNTLPCHIPK